YYHLPSQKQILSWIEKVGDDFHFCPKISQTISHRRRLKEVGESVRQFCEMVLTFGSKLGVSFLQLPPEFTTAYRERLVSFVKELPRELCWAIEFRHPSWLEAFETVGDFLQEKGVGTVITDVAGRRDVLHRHLTAPFVLIRFVGNSLHPTDYERLNQWAEVLKNWLQKEITVYFFIHQPSEKLCPETAVYFAQQVRRHLPSLSLVSPQIMNNIQGSLF
ncbi:MAG: DUF72 domain-containing protein, partial [Flammeovirgaceae bacterium]|nr:DUF72 domain-containing protein [Flammeovirgaceae bacterium]